MRVGVQPPWYGRTAVPGSRLVRLPKADATELAPEAIGTRPSHSDYNPGGLNRSPKRAFRFLGATDCFWWNSRAEALGFSNAKIAEPLLPGVPNWVSAL